MLKKFKVADLTGPELDMAVAMALGYVPYSGPWWQHKDDPARSISLERFHPSTDAQDGHPIIDNDWIGLERPSRGQTPPAWRALADFKGDRRLNPMGTVMDMWGPTALVAAMRAKVASIYGDTIEIDVPKTKRTA